MSKEIIKFYAKNGQYNLIKREATKVYLGSVFLMSYAGILMPMHIALPMGIILIFILIFISKKVRKNSGN